jgi:hypothetical protein
VADLNLADLNFADRRRCCAALAGGNLLRALRSAEAFADAGR